MRSRLLNLLGAGSDVSRREEDKTVQSEKLDMIQGIEELSQTTVKEMMVPRIDVTFVSADMDLDSVVSIITEMGYSRYPVYTDTIDNVIGMIYAKDILTYCQKKKEFSVGSIMRKAYFVPDSKKLDQLLREFKRRRIHIAIAVDEYGGVSGVICLEDILEMIVGDIQDEFDNETEDIVKLAPNSYLCDARAPIDEINEALGLQLPDEDFETIGGFVFEQFGKIPENLESIQYENIEFVVQSISGHKINTVKLSIKDTEG